MLVAVLEEEVGEEEEDDTDGREGKARALLAAVRFTTIFSRLFFCLLLLSIFWKIFISFLLKEKMLPTTASTTSLVTLLSLHIFLASHFVTVECRELTQPLAEPTARSPLLQSRRRVVPVGEDADQSHQTISSGNSDQPLLKDDEAAHQDFINDRVKVTLDCKPNLMRLHLNFTEPFRGVVSVGRSSYAEEPSLEATKCSIRGQGSRRYRLDLDHRSCRTAFDSKRGQFTNTLFVRYHPTLETGGDYSKTLLCKFGLTSFSVN